MKLHINHMKKSNMVQKLRAAKRGAKREKREAAARDALAEARAFLQTSPRPTAGRSRASAEPGGTPSRVPFPSQICRSAA